MIQEFLLYFTSSTIFIFLGMVFGVEFFTPMEHKGKDFFKRIIEWLI